MLKKVFKWDKPYALPLGEWSKWERRKKEEYPVKYFFFETIPDFYDDIKHYWRDNIKWPLLHRYHPKYRYNIVKTQLEPGYYDPDTLMIESMFALLHEFVEHMKEHEPVNWDSDESHKAAWEEMVTLDDWWKLRRTREERFEKLNPYPKLKHDGLEMFLQENEDDEDNKAWRDVAAIHNKQDELWHKDDEEMMIRLIKVRNFMWYP